jgi:3-phosphoshikimate 1-carboxyvinyltransferase
VQKTIGALRTLGFTIDGERVTGAGGRIPNPNVTLDLGGSATAFRFLTAVAATALHRADARSITLTGDASLQRRSMRAIVDALRQLPEVAVRGCGSTGDRPPLEVLKDSISLYCGPLGRPREVLVDVNESSQALSALLLIGPVWWGGGGGLLVRPVGESASKPYVALTCDVMAKFGSPVPFLEDVGGYRALGTGYQCWEGAIEGDWSSAAFLASAAVVTGGAIHVDGLAADSAQADRVIVNVLNAFGGHYDEPGFFAGAQHRRRPLDVDLRDAPDLAPLVGALGCVAEGTTRVRGAAHLRIKESDRIATVVAAARALGCVARELPDGFEIDGPARHGGLIETHHDHRIAMAFAVAGLAIPGVVIDDPACVAKSYPGFWRDLHSLIGVG